MKIDDDLAFKITEKVNIFEYIHPNYITISGILSNFVIYHLLVKKKNKKLLIGIILYRYLTDILDGCVARKYKKTSKLGGYLDTINDFMLFIIISYLHLEKKYFILTFIFASLYIIKFDLFYDHSNIKIESTISGFLVNNSILIYSILIILIYIYT